jgi:ribosomal protein L37AE/L43A
MHSKYHCNACGQVYCKKCSAARWLLPHTNGSGAGAVVVEKEKPVCNNCLRKLQRDKHQKMVQMAKLMRERSTRVDLVKQAKAMSRRP